MRACGYAGIGDASVLRPLEVDEPVAAFGSVVIDVIAAGVNRADIGQREGSYPPPPGASALPGLEVSGVVSSVGEGVARWRAGDRVCALLAGGGYAERVAVDERHVLPVPRRSTWRMPPHCPRLSRPCGSTCSSAVGCAAANCCWCTAGRAGSAPWPSSSPRREALEWP